MVESEYFSSLLRGGTDVFAARKILSRIDLYQRRNGLLSQGRHLRSRSSIMNTSLSHGHQYCSSSKRIRCNVNVDLQNNGALHSSLLVSYDAIARVIDESEREGVTALIGRPRAMIEIRKSRNLPKRSASTRLYAGSRRTDC